MSLSGCLTMIMAFASPWLVCRWFDNVSFFWVVGLFFGTIIAACVFKKWRYFLFAWIVILSILYGMHCLTPRATPEYVEYPKNH